MGRIRRVRVKRPGSRCFGSQATFELAPHRRRHDMFVNPIMAYAAAMSGNRDLLVLEFLLRLGAKVDVLTGEVRDLRQRVTA